MMKKRKKFFIEERILIGLFFRGANNNNFAHLPDVSHTQIIQVNALANHVKYVGEIFNCREKIFLLF